ncbi:MAG TPA: cupin domain-containing protein [Vicinamibacterales bacterium]|nr:cupin domain-containing protein [Vicinamibacterales bacterium]
MKTAKKVTLLLATVLAVSALTVAARAWQAAQPTFTRTVLQDHPLTIKDRHAVMSRSDFQPGAESGRHTHPGEEIGYILEGTLELTIDGKAPQRLKAGDVIFMPAGAVHAAKNVGTGTLRVLSTYVLEVGKPLATPVK